MPRKPREEVEDGIHHVFARGNNREAIYRDDADREVYLTALRMTVTRAQWHCLAYCLMDNHMHLLIQTPKANLGPGMQRLHGLYARQFNDRYDRCGHVFQGRYRNKRVVADEQLWTVTRYIARNPVEAGLCAAAPDWRWSSHAAVLDGTAPPWLAAERLLAYFGGPQPLERYRSMIDGEVEDVVRALTPTSRPSLVEMAARAA
jgi:putative transposase